MTEATARGASVFRPVIAAGDALIEEVRAGKWPRQARALGLARDELPPWPFFPRTNSPDAEREELQPLRPARTGDAPPRPEGPHGPPTPGGADQVGEAVDPLELPPHLRRDPANRAPWMVPPPPAAQKSRRAGKR